jgi:hypothetical protein
MTFSHRSCSAAVRIATIAITVALSCVTVFAASPPPDLVKLEKLVSLELAHARDKGPTDPAKRKLLSDAKQLDQDGENAIKAGDYKAAEEHLLKARVLLRQLKD